MEEANEKIFELYDNLLSAALVNLYSVSKDNKEIRLSHLSLSKEITEEEKVVIEIAKILSGLYGWKIYLGAPLFKYFKILKNNWHSRKKFKRQSPKLIRGLSPWTLLHDTSRYVTKVDYPYIYGEVEDIWKNIYYAYYASEKEKKEYFGE